MDRNDLTTVIAELATVKSLIKFAASREIELPAGNKTVQATAIAAALLPEQKAKAPRMARDERVAALKVLHETHGDKIPGDAIREAGFPKSAYLHGPYWSAQGPGSVAAYDLDMKSALHRTKTETWLTLKPLTDDVTEDSGETTE